MTELKNHLAEDTKIEFVTEEFDFDGNLSESLENINESEIVTGTVTKITDFGAFVKLEDGVEGLVHVSELDWGHIAHPRDVLKQGETVEVKVLSVDPQERRISLSIRELKANPWRKFVEGYSLDQVIEGEITEIKDFGAFMKITNDVDGLIHVSEISDQRIATPKDVLTVGDKVQAKIIGINEDKKQVRLTMRNLFGPPEVPVAREHREPRKPRSKKRPKERLDSAFLDGGGHESLSMRDLLSNANVDDSVDDNSADDGNATE